MNKLKVSISWSGNNYCAETHHEALNGIIISAHKSLETLKKDFKESLQFHIEGCLRDNDKLPEWIVSGQYELDYVLETSALLHSLDGILTRSAIARVSGINEKMIGHYASGYRNPRPKQREKIINGIYTISRELTTVYADNQ
jgi:predicted RNase H-like HicB family nuclease